MTLTRRFESLPTLRAISNGAGGPLEVTLENGGLGAFALFYGRELRATPLVIAKPPTWHALELLLEPGHSGRLALDAFTASGQRELVFLLPNDPSLIGIPFHLQAWCQRGLAGSMRYSFTNSVEASF